MEPPGITLATGSATPAGSDDDELRVELRKAANRILIDAQYTGRQHLVVGQWWGYVRLVLGLPAAILVALTSAGAAVSALTNGDPQVTAALSVISAVITAIKATLRPDEQASSHTSKGGDYVTLRNDASDYMEIDLRTRASMDALVDRQKRLRERLEGLRAREPRGLPPFVYRIVKAQIKRGQYDYQDDPLWTSGP